MAMRRPVKFFIGFIVLFFVVGVLALAGAWMMMLRGPSVPDHATLVLRIGGELVETPPNDVLGQVTGGAKAQTVRGYVETLRRAKNDPRIESVLIVPSPLRVAVLGQGAGDPRRRSSTSGSRASRISAFLEYGGDREYYLATAADRIYLLPSSSARCEAASPPTRCSCSGTLDKIGAQADFEHIGDYKTAPNQLTADDLHAGASRDDASRSPATCTTSSCAASPRRARNTSKTCAR